MGKTLAIIGVKNLGRTIALHFAKKGWTVLAAARTRDTVEALAKEIDAAGGKGIPIVLDLQVQDSLKVLNEYHIDLLVSAQSPGGRFGSKPIFEIDDQELEQGLNTSVKGTWNLLKVVGPKMVERGSGAIFQIGTTSALRTKEGFAVLGTVQFALKGLVQVAARELRQKNIHVAFIPADGPIESEKTQPWLKQIGIEKALPEEEIAKSVEYLFEQHPRAWTHELILRPAMGDWTAPV